MPEGAPLPKAEATRGYGAEVILEGETIDDAPAEPTRSPPPAPPYISRDFMRNGRFRARYVMVCGHGSRDKAPGLGGWGRG